MVYIIMTKGISGFWWQVAGYPCVYFSLDLAQQRDACAGVGNAHHVTQVAAKSAVSSIMMAKEMRVRSGAICEFIYCLYGHEWVEAEIVSKQTFGVCCE